MAEWHPRLVVCECGTHIALLPSDVYTNVDGVDPGVIEDEKERVQAMFAIVDSEGDYACPNCGRQHRMTL